MKKFLLTVLLTVVCILGGSAERSVSAAEGAKADPRLITPEEPELTRVEISVTWFETKAELQEKYREITTQIGSAPTHRVNGFQVWGVTQAGTDVCMIFVLRPRQVDDERVTVIGHEIMHCLMGRYHAEE